MALVLAFHVGGSDVRELTVRRNPLGLKCRTTSQGGVFVKSVRLGSHADELGIELGWQVLSVHGVSVRAMGICNFNRMLRECLEEVQTSSEFGHKDLSQSEGIPIFDAMDDSSADADTVASEKDLLHSDILEESCEAFDEADHVDERDSTYVSLEITFRTANHSLLTRRFLRRPLGLLCGACSSGLQVENVQRGSHGEDLGVKAGWRISQVQGSDIEHLPALTIERLLREFLEELDGADSADLRADQADDDDLSCVLDARGMGDVRLPSCILDVRGVPVSPVQGVKSMLSTSSAKSIVSI